MTEILGIISSGAAIGQATAAIPISLIKLNELWNEFRDVPEDLAFLVRQIEILHLLFEENENQVSRARHISPPRSVERACKLVNNGAHELEALVDELQGGLKQRRGWKAKVATAKVVLKSHQIKRCKSRLKATVTLLNLAKQCQMTSMLEMQPSYLASMMEEVGQLQKIKSGGTASDNESLSLQISTKETKHRRGPSAELAFRYKLRFLSRQWNLCVYRSQVGWDCGFRTRNTVSDLSPVAHCIYDDDVNALRQLFETGAASPFDLLCHEGSDTRSYTLLTRAVMFGSHKSFRLLQNQGLNAYEESLEDGRTILFAFLCLSYRSTGHKGGSTISRQQSYLSIGEMLLQDFQRINFRPSLRFGDHDYGLLSDFNGTLVAFQLIQASCCPDYYESSFENRARIAKDILPNNTPDTTMAALGAISSLGIDQFLAPVWRPYDTTTTLFDAVAYKFGHALFEPRYQPSSREVYKPLWDSSDVEQENGVAFRLSFDPEKYPMRGWQALVGQILNKGADVNRCGLFGTPLIQMLRGVYSLGWRSYEVEDVLGTVIHCGCYFQYQHNKGEEALLAWLQTLQGFGIDLERYGKTERKLFYQESSSWRNLELCMPGRDEVCPLRLVGLQVGPKPEDWKVWLSEPSDEFAGEFWDMLEHPERTIPGAWDEFTW